MRWPGYLSKAEGIKFEDLPGGAIASSRSPSPLPPPRPPLVAPTPRPHRSLPWTRSASTARSLASLPRRRASHRSVIARLDSSASPTPLAPSPRPALASSSVRPFPSRALSLDSPRAHARTPRSHARAHHHHHHRARRFTPRRISRRRRGRGREGGLSSSHHRSVARSRPARPGHLGHPHRSTDRLDRDIVSMEVPSRSVVSIGHLDRSIDRSIDRSSRSVDRSVVSIGSVSIGRLDRAVGRSRDAREDAGLDARWRRARARWWWDRRDVGGCDR